MHIKTLLTFPYLHSDETWLGGLSLTYLDQKHPFITEPFFDLFPRTPHLIKVFFHALQSAFISLFGYSLFSLRFMSLLFGMLSLFFTYKLFNRLGLHKLHAFLGTMLLGLNIQFMYASHFARQEMILFSVLIISYLLLTYTRKSTYMLSAILIGLSVGFHPNAFILAIMIGLCLFINIINKQIKIKDFILWVGIVGFTALIFPLITLLQNPSFIVDYYTYGKTLSVDAPIIERFNNYIAFYQKIFLQVSGTYYIPNIRIFLISFPILFLSSGITKTYHKIHWQHAVGMLIGFNLSLFVIGRFNTTSILFIFFPWIILIVYEVIAIARKIFKTTHQKFWSVVVLFSFISLLSLYQFLQANQSMLPANYSRYSVQIKENLSKEGSILGNLSSGFSFYDREFYDIRNLSYLEKGQLNTYIKKNNIKTIIYYEEYDYIHRNPMWNILYGSDSTYYDDLQNILQDHGVLIHEFESPYYGTRIIRFMGDYPWKVQIYHLTY
jgi:4-amino-4-deoxy-L-arabinose transferase-like glycosyltransferase